MLYREADPPEDLKHFVLSFWEFTVPEDFPSPAVHELFPDGCVSLFYIRNLKRRFHFAGLSGMYLESITKPIFAGDKIWGMRFSPAACAAILGSDPLTMVGRSTLDEIEFPHLLSGLIAELRKCVSFDEAVPVLANRLRPVKKPYAFDAAVSLGIDLIEALRGEIYVDDIAQHLGLSTRQFQRRFKSASGLSPKTYIRARRFRASVVDLVEQNSNTWAGRAAELGFADQSHLTKEFVAITKRTPNSFAKKIGDIRHGDLVK